MELDSVGGRVHVDMVSIIVPCRNEKEYIERFCAGVLEQVLSSNWVLQLVIADGMSDDGTRGVLDRLALSDSRIVWIDNPAQIASAGLNRALKHATGSVIVRMDVHSEYAPDYVSQCLKVLAETGASNVGGAWRAEADDKTNAMQSAIAMAFQSRWVAGGALSRQVGYDGWADTVYLGCWPRSAFEQFGEFDEQLVRNQDDEHNLRIVKGGGRIWQSSRIRSVYRPRRTLRRVFAQYVQYGYWKPFVMRKHGQPAALRQLIPGLLVLGLVASLMLLPTSVPSWLALVLPTTYAALLASLVAAIAIEARPSLGVLARLPFVVAAYHLGLWAGFSARMLGSFQEASAARSIGRVDEVGQPAWIRRHLEIS